MGNLTEFLDKDLKDQNGVVLASSSTDLSVLVLQENDTNVIVSTTPGRALTVKLPPVSKTGGRVYAIMYTSGPAGVTVTDAGDDPAWVDKVLAAGNLLIVYSTGRAWVIMSGVADLQALVAAHMAATSGASAHALVTQALNGFMSAADKVKLDSPFSCPGTIVHDLSAANSTLQVRGVGFKPRVILAFVATCEAAPAKGFSLGMAWDSENGNYSAFDNSSLTEDTWGVGTALVTIRNANNADYMQAYVSAFADDGFDLSFVKVGDLTGMYQIHWIAWR